MLKVAGDIQFSKMFDVCWIRVSHGSDYEENGLLGCDVM
jgi:hypothetical protein